VTACITDSVGAFERILVDVLFNITKFSRSAADFQLPGLRHNGDAGRIIAAVLELAQAFDDDRHDFLGPDIADYSAHTRRLLRKILAAQQNSMDLILPTAVQTAVQSTISKRYSSMTVLVSTSFEMCSSCFWASSRLQPSRFRT